MRGFGAITDKQVAAAKFTLDQSYGNSANDGFSVEGFTKLKISEGSDQKATIRYGTSDFPDTAYAYSPDLSAPSGDVWFGRDYDYGSPKAGNYAWQTLMHETGHALGLKHPHERSGPFQAMDTAHDAVEYTIMSYRSFVGGAIGGYSYGASSAPQTYMMADVAALQRLYGADFTTNSGKTVYSWDPDSGNTFVNGKVAIDAVGQVIFATIWDGGGKDTYDLSAYSTDLHINLSPGESSTFSNSQLADLGYGHFASGSIYNALLYHNNKRSLIENAIGGSGNDTIEGNNAKNVLYGGYGNDTLHGLRGNDVLYGGEGNDVLDGGPGADKLVGGNGDDILTGGMGRDVFVFRTGGGSDQVTDFVPGTDKLSFDIDGMSASAVLSHASQSGDDVIIQIDANTIVTLSHVLLSELSVRDFI